MRTQASTAQATGVSVLGRASIATVGSHGRAVVTKVFQRFLWVGKRWITQRCFAAGASAPTLIRT
jgi:integral membrane sensor domain MASE1